MTDYDAALSGGAVLRLSVTTAAQSIENNTSTLSWSLTLYKGSFSSFSFDPIPWSVTINGVPYSGSYTFDFRSSSSKLIAASSTVVAHSADGTPGSGKFSVSGYTGATGTSTGGPATASGTYVPATIPRASTPTFELVSAPGVLITECDAGLAIKLNMNRASSGFTHTIDYSIGATGWQSIATGVGADYSSWTIPLSLLNQIPAALSGALAIRVKTYNGATLIGEKTVNLTMKAGAAIVPDLGTITHSEATSTPDVASLIGGYVQGVSTLAVAITSPVGIYGSTITAQKIEVVGQSGNQVTNASPTALSGTLPNPLAASGTVTLRATVTDSRNRTYTEDVTITVLAYTLPSILAVTARRALSGGTLDQNGTYIRVDLNAAVQSLVVSSTQRNALVYRVSTSPRGANTWTVKATTTPGGLTFNSHAEYGTYLISASFDVKIELIDDLAVVAVVLNVATSEVPLHLGASGVGVRKFWEQGALDVGGDIYQNGVRVAPETDLISSGRLAGLPALLSAPDLNSSTFRTNGWWEVYNPSNGPYPTGAYYWRLRTWALDVNWFTQEAECISTPSWHADSPDTRWRRTYRNGTWTPWLPEHSRGSQAGSTALRNSIFGTPSTAAQKLALQGASWWNTERAWEERYFAKYDASTQPNGLSKLADGWYPVHGLLPSEKRWQSSNYTINGTGRLLQWDTQVSVVHDDLLTYSGGTFTIVQPGRWRFLSRAMCSTGATSYFNQRAEVSGSVLENTGTPTSGASFVTNIVEVDRALAAGVTVQFAQLAGAAYTGIASDYGGQSTTVLAEYIGPA